MEIVKIWATCPHCHKEIFTREVIDSNRQKRGNTVLNKAFDVLRSSKLRKNVLTYAKIAFWRYALRSNPLYETFNLVSTEENKLMSFVTGCPNCNKKVKIYLEG